MSDCRENARRVRIHELSYPVSYPTILGSWRRPAELASELGITLGEYEVAALWANRYGDPIERFLPAGCRAVIERF